MSLVRILKSVTVEPIVFLYMMIIMLEGNVLKELIYTKSCLNLLPPENASLCNSASKQNITEVLKEATYWSKYCSVCLFCFTFLTGFYVAAWSDRFARKIFMIIPSGGTIVASILLCLSSFYIYSSVAYVLIPAAISGLTFGSVGLISSAFAYIADVTTEKSRTIRIVILEATIFIGGTCGIEIGGLFLSGFDFNVKFNKFIQVFIFEMFVAFVILLYTLIRIPSNPREQHSLSSSWISLFSLKYVTESLRTVFQKRTGKRRKSILLLLLALTFLFTGTTVNFSLIYYFLKNHPLYWSFSKYSLFNSMQFAVQGVSLLFGLPIALRTLHLSDGIVGVIGTLSRVIGYITLGLSKNDAMVYSCLLLSMFSEFPTPTIRSMLSKLVNKDERGKIFAICTILQNIVFLIGSFTLVSLFESTLTFFPGFTFELVAGLHIATLLIFLYLHYHEKQNIISYTSMENDISDPSVDGNVNAIVESIKPISS